MNRFLTLFFCLLLFSHLLYAQIVRKPVAASYIGPGAYSNSHIDVFSFTANQAALARLKNSSVGIYGEKRYMLNELGFYNTAFALPTSSGNFAVKGGYFGFSDYNETQAGLAYARQLGDKIDIGVQFNYYNIRTAGYGSASAISAEAGVIMHLTEKLNAGFHIANPMGAKFGKNSDEKLPFVYSAGLGYEGSENFFISLEVEKEESMPVNVNAALQYRFAKQLFARAGIVTNTSAFWLGAGVLYRAVRIDATATYHPQLGITPGLLLIFNFSKPKEEDKH